MEMDTNGVPADVEGEETCANCGKHGSNTVKLKSCTACRLVKYCGVDCQKAHRKQHKKACKQRAAELKDEQLYSQGHERPEGDFCPICAADSVTSARAFVFQRMLHEEIVQRLSHGGQEKGHVRLCVLQNALSGQ